MYSVESDGVTVIELKKDMSSLEVSNELHYIKKHFWDAAGKQLNIGSSGQWLLGYKARKNKAPKI